MTLASEVLNIQKGLREKLKNKDQNIVEVAERFKSLSNDLAVCQELHAKCLTLFDQENLSQFFIKQKEFQFQKRQLVSKDNAESQKQEDGERYDLLEDDKPLTNNKTEVFENFELIEHQSQKNQKSRYDIQTDQLQIEQQRYPQVTFMSELKQTLLKRQQKLDDEQLIYKEFDPNQGKFIEISKEDREIKNRQLEIKLNHIKQEELRLKREAEREMQNLISSRQKNKSQDTGGMNDLFAELKKKAGNKLEEDEIFE